MKIISNFPSVTKYLLVGYWDLGNIGQFDHSNQMITLCYHFGTEGKW
jgi:hypothetical protein